MKKITQKQTSRNGAAKTETVKPLDVEVVFESDNSLGNYHSMLLMDQFGRFYLTSRARTWCPEMADSVEITRNGAPGYSKLEQLTEGMLEPMTPRECLEWYGKVHEFVEGGTGDLGVLCRAAAEAWPA